tara:strand:- start:1808 stop:4708 length:2901 start_codon:yes stop_codon:yes gene_type:complete
MLTNQDRRAILEQVKSSGSGDIIAALQGQPVLPQQEQMQEQQVQQEPASIPPSSPSPVNNVSMETPPVGQDSLVNSFSNTSPQIQDLPTGSAEPQLLKTGGVKSHGGLHTAEASSTAVAPVNIPTIITPETDQERMIRLATQQNSGTIYDPTIGNNPNKQWISGASNQMYATNKAKESSQDYGEAILGFAAPIPFLNSMKVSSSGAKIPGLIDDVILGPAAKVVANASKTAPVKNVTKKASDISTFVKESLQEFMPGAKNFSKVKVVNPTSKGAAENLLKTKEGQKAFLKEFEDGAVTIDKVKDRYIKNLSSAEGKKRLLAQEADYLRSIGFGNGDEALIKGQAKINAESRELEILLTENRNAEFAGGVFPKGETVKTVASDSYHFNNAVYRQAQRNPDDVFLKNGELVLDTSNPAYFARPITKGGKVNPGSVTLGNKFTGTSGNRVAAHEIGGHGLQSGRQLPVDKRLIKGITPESNLSKLNQESYDYFLKSGHEPSAYIHGLRQQLLDDGLIKKYYQNISPELLKRAKTIYKIRPSGVLNPMEESFSSNTRILDFMSGTKKNFNLLSNELNKLPAIIPAVGGAAAVSEKRLGGFEDPQEKLEIDYSKTPGKKKKLATTGNETSYRQHMMNYLYDAGADTSYANIAMNAIGEHESRNIANRKQDSYKYIQLPPDITGKSDSVKVRYDGPGRGAYQFETGEDEGGSTAFNRNATFTRDSTARTFNQFPTIYPEGKKISPDFSKLSREDQDGLFLGDKMNRNKSAVKSFYKLIAKDGTPPTQEEVFQFWLNNHKQAIGKTKIKDATPAQIEKERKAWNARTKNMFKTGGIFTEEDNPNFKVRKLVLKNTKKPKSKTELELKADTISTAFNNYTNPTLINNKNLNLQAAMGVNPNIGWNPNDKSFSKYGTPNLNLEGSFGLSGQYVKNNFSASAGVNFQTGNKPTYKAGIEYNFKLGGYKKKCKYGCW